MLYMEPVIAPFVSEVALRLRDLIGVMWENIIHTATMDIHVLAKMLDTDAGTLNMPARITDTPWTIPFKCLIFKFGFCKPENKVCLILLIRILIDIIPYTDQRLEFCLCRENIVIIQFGCVKINISSCLICITLFQQSLDHFYKFRNAVRCRFHNVRCLDV